MWPVILKLGRLRVTALISVFSVLMSLSISLLIDRIMHRHMPLSGLVPAILAPGLIAPICTWKILGLLFKIHGMQEEMRALATYDHLTGVYSRRAFLEISRQYFEVAKRESKGIAVLYIDIDHFKKINDGYGHAEGDRVLIAISSAIGGAIRRSDILGRYGGEEFLITLLGVGERDAIEISEKIRKIIERTTVDTNAHSISASISIGIAVSREGAHESLDDLIREADRALYASKNGGRNRSTLYSADLM